MRKLFVITLMAATLITLGCATNRPAGEQIDDAVITSKIKTKLTADPEVNPFNIDVDTEDGVVRLSGKVSQAEARREAVRLARDTQGVRRVINEITVGERTVSDRVDDASIVTRLKAKITADPDLNPLNIDVDSEDGVVTLSGQVESNENREEAERLAKNTEGVRKVNNRLKVQS